MENEAHVDRELENLDLHSFLRVVRNLSRFPGISSVSRLHGKAEPSQSLA